MNLRFESIVSQAKTWMPFLQKLAHIFQDMDREYQKSAAAYGFDCQGCEETCCATRFYHHTLLELLYLYEGWQPMASEKKEEVIKRALNVRRAAMPAGADERMRILCPLNAENRCMLYAYRPMICRMHGVPHTLHHPVKGVVNGPGCHMFPHLSQGNDAFCFDRTPFYTAVAQLEKQLRQTMRITTKLSLTVADMMVFIDGKKTL